MAASPLDSRESSRSSRPRASRARTFYRDTLGLNLVEESPFAFVFDAHGTMLRLTPVQKVAAAGYTVLGWEVTDIEDAVKRLTKAGVIQSLPGNGAGRARHLAVAEPCADRLVQGSRRQHAERLAALTGRRYVRGVEPYSLRHSGRTSPRAASTTLKARAHRDEGV